MIYLLMACIILIQMYKIFSLRHDRKRMKERIRTNDELTNRIIRKFEAYEAANLNYNKAMQKLNSFYDIGVDDR
jgi:hypothetical protein